MSYSPPLTLSLAIFFFTPNDVKFRSCVSVLILRMIFTYIPTQNLTRRAMVCYERTAHLWWLQVPDKLRPTWGIDVLKILSRKEKKKIPNPLKIEIHAMLQRSQSPMIKFHVLLLCYNLHISCTPRTIGFDKIDHSRQLYLQQTTSIEKNESRNETICLMIFLACFSFILHIPWY